MDKQGDADAKVPTGDAKPGTEAGGGDDAAKLAELLDSTLDDFGKTLPNTAETSAKPAADGQVSSSPSSGAAAAAQSATTGPPPPGYAEDPDIPPIFMDPAMAQKAATDFTKMIQQLAELQKTMLQESLRQGPGGEASSVEGGPPVAGGNPPSSLMEAVAGLGPSPGGPGGGPMSSVAGEMGSFEPGGGDEQAFAAAMLENLNMLASKAQQVGQAQNEQEFQQAIEKLHEDETFENEFLPFMGGLMGTLLSKEMLYPSMSEIVGKYPDWIETHKSELSPDELSRYQSQLEIMKEICTEYEQESEDDPEDAKAARFQKIVVLLQQMQALGQPPQELAGDMPAGWSLDDQTGLPTITDQGAAAENCSIM